MAMTKEMELDCLRDALSRIGQREKQIDAELRRLPQTSDAFTERRVERAEILGLKRKAETRLNELLNPPPPDPRQKASIDALVKEREEQFLHSIERFERQGEHRQARIWRMELLSVRRSIIAEYFH